MRILRIDKNGPLSWKLGRCLAPLGKLAAIDQAGFDLTKPDVFAEVRIETQVHCKTVYIGITSTVNNPQLKVRASIFDPSWNSV